MKEFTNKWSNWWVLNPKRKQLDDAFEKELNELIEQEVALRQCNVMQQSEQLCDFFEADNKTSSATICKCGREKWEHPKTT